RGSAGRHPAVGPACRQGTRRLVRGRPPATAVVATARLAGNRRTSSALRDGVEEGAGDVATPRAGRVEAAAFAVEQVGQGGVAAAFDEAGIVELVAVYRCAGRAERAIGAKPRLSVAEIDAPRREARDMAEKPGHAVGAALAVDQRLAQHHEAAALA